MRVEEAGRVAADAAADGGYAVEISPADKLYGRTVFRGVWEGLAPGDYRVHFLLRGEGGVASPRAVAEVTVGPRAAGGASPWASRVIAAGAVAGGAYRDFSLDFTLPAAADGEFDVVYAGTAILYLDRVTLERLGDG